VSLNRIPSRTRHAFIRRAATLAVAVLLLAPGTASSAVVVLRWTAPGDDGMTGRADSYDLRRSETSPFTTSMDSWWNAALPVGAVPPPVDPGTRQSFEVANLDSGKVYYFVIRTVDEAGNWSSYSNVAIKSTIIVPGALQTPANFTARLVPNAVQLTWDESTDGVATGYKIYRRTGESALGVAVWSGSVTETSWEDASVTAGERYEYSLHATVGAGESDPPAFASVSIPHDALTATSPAMVGFPNPASGQVTLRFHTSTPDGAPGRVRIVIYDLSGRRVRALLDEAVPPGEHGVTWPCRSDAGNLVAPGVYHAILDGPNGRQVANLAIVP
jgi:hypothetical protein